MLLMVLVIFVIFLLYLCFVPNFACVSGFSLLLFRCDWTIDDIILYGFCLKQYKTHKPYI